MPEKRKVVIAEDNIELCGLLVSILEDEGFLVECVHDGFALLAVLKEKQDIDLVILDLMMPEKGGVSIFNTVRSLAPATKVIIYTGYTNYRHSPIAREADAFLSKTAGPEDLIKVIVDLLV